MKKLLPILILFSAFTTSIQVYAQQITISGTLLDHESGEPLGFASVGLKGEPYGTITNISGEFDFHAKDDIRNKIFAISMLGYEDFEIPVTDINFEQQITIRLKKIPQLLEEVVIADSLSGAEIVDIALNRISLNYPDKPYMLDGFYRDTKSVNNTYVSLLEAAISIFDSNYEEPRNPFKLREKVGLEQVRKSIGYDEKYIGYFDQGNLLENMLLNNNIRYYDFPQPDINNVYTRLSKDKLNGSEVHKVSARYTGVKMMIFIEVQTYAIVRVEYESDRDENIININNRYKDYLNRNVLLKKVIEYKKYQGKYYLHYMTLYKRNQWYHEESKTLDYDVELYQELLINEIQPNTKRRVKSANRMRKYGLQYQDQPYNEVFWKNYNVIKRTPLDKKIITDLEREGNLNQQFKAY